MAIRSGPNGIISGNMDEVAGDCCCDNLGESDADFSIDFDGFESSSCGTANCEDLNGFFQYLIYNPSTQSWVGFGEGFALEIKKEEPNWVLRGYDGTLAGTECFQFTQPINGGTRPTISPWVYNSGRPITYPEANYYHNGVRVAYYSTRNKYRIPDYHRLDLKKSLTALNWPGFQSQ